MMMTNEMRYRFHLRKIREKLIENNGWVKWKKMIVVYLYQNEQTEQVLDAIIKEFEGKEAIAWKELKDFLERIRDGMDIILNEAIGGHLPEDDLQEIKAEYQLDWIDDTGVGEIKKEFDDRARKLKQWEKANGGPMTHKQMLENFKGIGATVIEPKDWGKE